MNMNTFDTSGKKSIHIYMYTDDIYLVKPVMLQKTSEIYKSISETW